MDPLQWAMLAALALCVALSAFFSMSETAFMAANRVRLKTMQQSGNRRAGLALQLSEDTDSLLSTILVGNNLVNIAGTAIATVLFTRAAGDFGPTLSTVVMTILILVFGEVTPKTLARQSPERLAMAVAPWLKGLCWLFTPVNRLFALLQRALKHLHKSEEDAADIEAELITMVDEAREDGGMDDHESELIRSAIEFDDLDVKSIMTPRTDVTALPDDTSMARAAMAFRESGYSRLPVYHEDLDHVVGILNEKDFYAARHAGERDIRQIMSPPVYTPSSLKLSKLLRLCQSARTHLVIVLDEFGGMEGIVTLEDALEELVGEIWDEHDDISEEMVSIDDHTWQVDGRMQLSELMERLGISGKFEAETVGGWASELLGFIPGVGTQFKSQRIEGLVTAMDRHRVTQVRISLLPPAEEAKNQQEKEDESK